MALTSAQAPLLKLLPVGKISPVTGKRLGSILTSLQISPNNSARVSLIALWRMMTYPPFLQLKQWLMEYSWPHWQYFGTYLRGRSYRMQTASQSCCLFKQNPYLFSEREVSHVDAPFSDASKRTWHVRFTSAPELLSSVALVALSKGVGDSDELIVHPSRSVDLHFQLGEGPLLTKPNQF